MTCVTPATALSWRKPEYPEETHQAQGEHGNSMHNNPSDVTLLQHKQPTTSTTPTPARHGHDHRHISIFHQPLASLSVPFATTSSVACCASASDGGVTWLRATPMQLPILYSMSS